MELLAFGRGQNPLFWHENDISPHLLFVPSLNCILWRAVTSCVSGEPCECHCASTDPSPSLRVRGDQPWLCLLFWVCSIWFWLLVLLCWVCLFGLGFLLFLSQIHHSTFISTDQFKQMLLVFHGNIGDTAEPSQWHCLSSTQEAKIGNTP